MEMQLLKVFHGTYDLPVELKHLQYAENLNSLLTSCVKFLHYLPQNQVCGAKTDFSYARNQEESWSPAWWTVQRDFHSNK